MGGEGEGGGIGDGGSDGGGGCVGGGSEGGDGSGGGDGGGSNGGGSGQRMRRERVAEMTFVTPAEATTVWAGLRTRCTA